MMGTAGLSTVTLTGSLLHDSTIQTTKSGHGGLYSQKAKRERDAADAEEFVEVSRRYKLNARQNIIALRREKRLLQSQYAFDLGNAEEIDAVAKEFDAYYAQFVRHIRGRRLSDVEKASLQAFLDKYVPVPEGEVLDRRQRFEALKRKRIAIQKDVRRAKSMNAEIASAEKSYDRSVSRYQTAWGMYQDKSEKLHAAADRIEDVERVTREVHRNIHRMQRSLARIDARLRERLERDLIEKGLMQRNAGDRTSGRIRLAQTFRWPVRGRISAGFLDGAYEQHFNAKHWGIDIVVPQGTPVVASADGEVFLARDGGPTGYSYVLVGHRSGFATLYGHLSSIHVESGQQIAAGELIGKSGGTPGTYGAGTRTTGAHVHFETIQYGRHVDPRKILEN